MKIVINYDSCWRNSFLAGSNDEPLPKEGRKYAASKEGVAKYGIKKQDVTIRTVMGVLNRLIGEQNKLWKAEKNENYYFKGFNENNVVTFDDAIDAENYESVYLRRVDKVYNKTAFSGMCIVDTSNDKFSSDYSPELWGVLTLNVEELCDFIINGGIVDNDVECNPFNIQTLFGALSKEKNVKNVGNVTEAIDILDKRFSPEASSGKYYNKTGAVIVSKLYCSALYLQAERLGARFDTSNLFTKKGCITGISKYNFTERDFISPYYTGGAKRVWGHPYIKEEYVKGNGKVTSTLTKASGQLSITIDVDVVRANEIKNMVEAAGVSSFPLGKKGLAYVSKIDTREVRIR